MTSAELLKWFGEIAAERPREFMSGQSLNEKAAAWQTSASAALAAAFPPGHRVLTEWERAVDPKGSKPILDFRLAHEFEAARWNAMAGTFASAHDQLRNGRVEGFIDSVRAEAEDEVLEQAEALLDAGYLAAATVLAGGALEVHLRRLCEKNKLPLPAGPMSIEKYNSTVAQARNGGLTIYEKPEQSQVTSWGQLRNEAAHDPAKFKAARQKEEVQHLVAGVRQFIARIR